MKLEDIKQKAREMYLKDGCLLPVLFFTGEEVRGMIPLTYGSKLEKLAWWHVVLPEIFKENKVKEFIFVTEASVRKASGGRKRSVVMMTVARKGRVVHVYIMDKKGTWKEHKLKDIEANLLDTALKAMEKDDVMFG